jgi:O-acetyl-ADP-ribose deacetylase (regulator of RNase III)
MNENYLRAKMRRALSDNSQLPRCASVATAAYSAGVINKQPSQAEFAPTPVVIIYLLFV